VETDDCRCRGAVELVMTCVQEAELSEEGTMANEAVLKFDEKRRHERYHKKLWDGQGKIARCRRRMKNLEDCEEESER
jgi:hypothetical protein